MNTNPLGGTHSATPKPSVDTRRTRADPLGGTPGVNTGPTGNPRCTNADPLGGTLGTNTDPAGSLRRTTTDPLGGTQRVNLGPLGGTPTQNADPLGGTHGTNKDPLGGTAIATAHPLGGTQNAAASPSGVAQRDVRDTNLDTQQPLGGTHPETTNPLGGTSQADTRSLGGTSVKSARSPLEGTQRALRSFLGGSKKKKTTSSETGQTPASDEAQPRARRWGKDPNKRGARADEGASPPTTRAESRRLANKLDKPTQNSQGVLTRLKAGKLPKMPQRFQSHLANELSVARTLQGKRKTAITFERGLIPPARTEPVETNVVDDVVVGFITRDAATRALKPGGRKESRHTMQPELGDACRMYNKSSKRYTIELVVSNKGEHVWMTNLELALFNLHSHTIGIGAKRIHIPMDQRILRSHDYLEILSSIDEQFIDSEIDIVVWNVRDESGSKAPE